jgi:hypothetical protein
MNYWRRSAETPLRDYLRHGTGAGFSSSGDLLEGKLGNLRPGSGVLDGEAAEVALPIQIQNRVLVQILRFGDVGCLELNVKAVRLGEIFDFHDLNRRSKNAL